MHRWLPAMILILGVGLLPNSSVHATSLGTTDTVQNCNPSGPGSLSAVVAAAHAGDTVTFALDCTGASAITLTSWIPTTATPLTIDGTGHQIDVDGGGTTSVFDVPSGNTLTLRDLTISHAGGTVLSVQPGFPTEVAGAVYSEGTLTVIGCTFVNNAWVPSQTGKFDQQADSIDEEQFAQASLTINDSYFKNDGNAIVVFSIAGDGDTITNSTFDSNNVGDVMQLLDSPGNYTLTNDTFFNNAMTQALVEVDSGASITSSTFAFNTGQFLFLADPGTISIGSDIIDGGFQNYCGASVDLGYNAWWGFPGSECDLSSANHDALGPLGLAFGVSNNGGPVPTEPISAGSVAINLVPPGSLCPATDARGYARPGAGETNCTAGAYEYNASPTLARVVSFTVQRSGTRLAFQWRLADRTGVVGFNLYAGTHRLNHHLILVHTKPTYSYHVTWSKHSHFYLDTLLTNGAHLSIPSQ